MVPNGAAALEWQRVKDEISGDLTDLLREAPLQIQMVVNLVKPIISTFMSSLAETVAEQQESVSSLMSTHSCVWNRTIESHSCSVADCKCRLPFPQSCSTSSINRLMTSHVELAF